MRYVDPLVPVKNSLTQGYCNGIAALLHTHKINISFKKSTYMYPFNQQEQPNQNVVWVNTEVNPQRLTF